jgi:ATP-dependent helicase/nuclease subunit B
VFARAEELRARDELRAADEYEQLWEILVDALDQMYAALGNVPATEPEFKRLLQLLLSQYDVGVIPVALDRVTIGGFSLSRRRDVRALIVLGATDEQMPKAPEASGVLSLSERDALTKLGLPLAETSETLLSREMNTIYATLTLPSETLYLLYPEGGSARPSYLAERLTRLYGARVNRLDERALMAVAETPYREYRAIHSAPADAALPSLSPAAARALYGETLSLSATRVESFNECRYAFFLKNGLRLAAREPVTLDALGSGTFVHYILENLARAAQTSGGFGTISEDDVRSLTREYTGRYIAAHFPDFEDKTERFRYLFRRLAADTENVAQDLSRELAVSDFEPLRFEARFSVPAGDGLDVTGVIDRVDGWLHDGKLYLRVTDYKTGRKAFELSDLWYGLGLQMLIYLNAVGTNALTDDGAAAFQISCESSPSTALGNAVPSAALYVPARDEIYNANRNVPDAVVEAELRKSLRRQGLILAEPEVIEAMERGEKRYLPVTVSKSGELTGGSLLSLERIGRLTRLAMSRLREVSRELRAGNIAPEPYYKSPADNACRYCDYHAACPYGLRASDKPRYIQRIKPDEFWKFIQQEDAL